MFIDTGENAFTISHDPEDALTFIVFLSISTDEW